MKSKNLRRLLAAVLCLMMVLSLFTACSKKEKDDDDDDDEETSQTDKDDKDNKIDKDAPNDPDKYVPTEGTSNSYKTPLDNLMDQLNAKSYKDMEKAAIAETNGLFEAELKKIREIEKESENYEDDLDDAEDEIREMVDSYKAEYGDDYEFYYEIDDKDEIKKSDLTASKKSLKAYAEQQEEYYKELKDDDERLEQIAETLGLKKSQVEDLVDLQIDIYKKLQKVEITEGYELDVTCYVKGSELDEPEEYLEGTGTIKVYKIDGKWVQWHNYYDGFATVEDAEEE